MKEQLLKLLEELMNYIDLNNEEALTKIDELKTSINTLESQEENKNEWELKYNELKANYIKRFMDSGKEEKEEKEEKEYEVKEVNELFTEEGEKDEK